MRTFAVRDRIATTQFTDSLHKRIGDPGPSSGGSRGCSMGTSRGGSRTGVLVNPAASVMCSAVSTNRAVVATFNETRRPPNYMSRCMNTTASDGTHAIAGSFGTAALNRLPIERSSRARHADLPMHQDARGVPPMHPRPVPRMWIADNRDYPQKVQMGTPTRHRCQKSRHNVPECGPRFVYFRS